GRSAPEDFGGAGSGRRFSANSLRLRLSPDDGEYRGCAEGTREVLDRSPRISAGRVLRLSHSENGRRDLRAHDAFRVAADRDPSGAQSASAAPDARVDGVDAAGRADAGDGALVSRTLRARRETLLRGVDSAGAGALHRQRRARYALAHYGPQRIAPLHRK